MRKRLAYFTLFTSALVFSGFMLATAAIAGLIYRPINAILTWAERVVDRKEIEEVEKIIREDAGNGGEW